MKAVTHNGKAGLQGLSVQDVPSKKPGYGEVKVKLKSAGLNHRDLFLMNNKSERDPHVILGSDGAGIIEEVGEGVSNVAVSNRSDHLPDIELGFDRECTPYRRFSEGLLTERLLNT